MRQEPRLQFTKEERAAPELEKPIRKADRAADKAEKARAKIPKKKIRFEETVTDPATGKTVTHLRFEEVDKKKPPSKLSHAVRDAPGNAVLSKAHKEIRESEEDNVGVESAHKMEEAAETVSYTHLRWKRDYAPKTPEDDWHPLFGEALQKQAHVEYLRDVLLFSDMGERAVLIASYGKEVRSLERRMADLAAGAAAGRDGRHRSRPAAPEQMCIRDRLYTMELISVVKLAGSI